MEKVSIKKDEKDDSDSLTLSILPDNNKKENSDDSISEHISSGGTSIENDRSFQEIEISNIVPNLFTVTPPSDVQHISQENRPDSLNSSVISLNYINNPVQSILEEILNNEQFLNDNTVNSAEDIGDFSNIFANVDLEDCSITNYRSKNEFELNNGDDVPLIKKIRDFEELIAVKDSTIAALNSELDSLRELSSVSVVSTTEYKQLQEECQHKMMEYGSAILYKNELIEKLSESLDQSVNERKELLNQIEKFREEIAQLQNQLKEMSQMLDQHDCNNQKTEEIIIPVLNLESEYSTIEETLNEPQLSLLNELKTKINRKIKTFEDEKNDYEMEIKRLRDLLANIKCGSTEIMDLKTELEAKHSREMEDLRQYFEKKCADVEKHYSEEIFSRKMSGSSCSEGDLNSEALFGNQPGPGGDLPLDSPTMNLTQSEVERLKNELELILQKINEYNLDNISDADLGRLKSDLNKNNFNILHKYDLITIRNDLQNKYHAELELLREDFENRTDTMRVEYEEKIMELNEKLNNQMVVMKNCAEMSSTNQEVASSGEFEINEVVQSYERRLQEQVMLAKIDIINELENQIQKLVANEAEDEEWPTELLQLRDRFSEKYKLEIEKLNEEHEKEIENLKDEHLKILNGALERARRRSLRDSDSLNKGELELLKERDYLKKQTVSLRNFVGELLKYFTQCEDELNNTLVEELLKTAVNEDLNDSSTTTSSKSDPKRVHLTPNFTDLINMIDSSVEESESKDISIDLKNELEFCLEKLKQDANAILTLSTNLPQRINNENGENLEQKLSSLTRKFITETQTKEQLKTEMEEAICVIQSLEKEKVMLENQLDEMIVRVNYLEMELGKAKDKIGELIENGHKEIVSEGYGDGQVEYKGFRTLSDLQEAARTMLVQSRASADPQLLQLIEELCRAGEKIKEEARKDKMDLLQQIEAADKKYKTTQQFLDDQAQEREQERDEAQKQINQLYEILKERDKDKASHEIMSSEGCISNVAGCTHSQSQVDELEKHLQEMTILLTQQADKNKEIELERNEAVEKIKVLRDIIRELEIQRDQHVKEINEHLVTIDELQCIVDQQNRSIDELKQYDTFKDISDIHDIRTHISTLENELQQLRLSSELAGNEGVLKQIKLQLFEIEVDLGKKVRDLEAGLHQNQNSCSSPSEEMSIRDLVRPQTPSTMVMDECEVPLQQLARLKEKLIRHSRAEDAALKRIRDLEMQVFNLKADAEENQNERDFMKKQIQEQLVLISDLQIRLDEQRIRAEHIEKQTNTSLESRIYDLQNEILELQEKNMMKEKNNVHLNAIVQETKKRLKDLEYDFANQKDDEIIVEMQKEIEKLRNENHKMKEKFEHEYHTIPNLVGNIIQDKNGDIEKLERKLKETEELLEQFTSLNLDRRELQTIANLKKSGNSFSEIFAALDLSQPEQARREEFSMNSLESPHHKFLKENANETPEISAIGPIHTIQGKSNSTEIHGQKRVHFEDETKIKQLEERLCKYMELENQIEILQNNLVETEKALATATVKFESEQEEMREIQKKLQVELADRKMEISEKLKQIAILEEDSKRKDEMMLNMVKENKETGKKIREKDNEIETLKDRVDEIEKLQSLVEEKDDEIEKLQSLIDVIEKLHSVIEEKDNEIDKLHKQLGDLEKLKDELSGKENCIEESEKKCENLTHEVAHLQELVNEKNKIISQITEDSRQLHVNLVTIKSKLNQTGNIVDLANKLREEQKKTGSLLDEIQNLKTQLLEYETKKNLAMIESVEEIAGQVERQLLYGAQIDTNILTAVNDSIVETQDIEIVKRALQKEKLLIDEKTKQLHELELKFSDIQNLLEKEKLSHQQTQIEDGKLIEQMRLQLDAALDKEEQLQKLYDNEKITKDGLEKEIGALRRSNTNSSTEYKQLPNQDVIALQEIKEENNKLTKKIRILKQEKVEVTANNKYLKKMLGLEEEQTKTLRAKINELLEEQSNFREQIIDRKVQLEQKVKECESHKILLDEVVQEKFQLEKQKYELVKKCKDLSHNLKAAASSNVVTEQYDVPFSDLVGRCDYLFAKNLKLESLKKALIWQKHYLLYVTISQRNSLSRLKKDKPEETKKSRSFRSIVFVCISIARMKYLVRRWHTSPRIVSAVNSRYYRHFPTQFQIGQPVSNQHFTTNRLSVPGSPENPQHDLSWSGKSPPCKENARLTSNRVELEAPKLLAQFAERFDNIQERLGFVVHSNTSST